MKCLAELKLQSIVLDRFPGTQSMHFIFITFKSETSLLTCQKWLTLVHITLFKKTGLDIL